MQVFFYILTIINFLIVMKISIKNLNENINKPRDDEDDE